MLSLVVNCPIQAWDKKSDTALVVLQRSCRFLRISPGPPDLWALPLEPKTFRSCRWSTRAAATCLVSGTWSSKNRHVKQNFNVFPFIFEIAATKNASFQNGKLPKFFFLFSQIDGGLPCYQPSVTLHKLSCLAGGRKNTFLTCGASQGGAGPDTRGAPSALLALQNPDVGIP
jgi:hypothetical protein